MRVTELSDKRSLSLSGAPKNKSEALDQVVELMAKSGKINDKEAYRKQVYAGEEESTTVSERESRKQQKKKAIVSWAWVSKRITKSPSLSAARTKMRLMRP